MDFSNFVMDQQIALAVNHFSNSFFDWFFPFITDLHKTTWFKLSVFLPLFAIWLFRDGKLALKSLPIFITFIALNDFICGSVIKHFFMRPRPFVVLTEIIQRAPASGFSFVSGHAANSFFIASFFAEIFPSQKILFFIVSTLISYSRVYNGVHFPFDVFIGALIGFTLSQLALKSIKSLLLARNKASL